MDLTYRVRISLGHEPERLPAAEPLEPREVDRLCANLKWPDAYCASWLAYAADLPALTPDGKPMNWTLRQVRGLLAYRWMAQNGRLPE